RPIWRVLSRFSYQALDWRAMEPQEPVADHGSIRGGCCAFSENQGRRLGIFCESIQIQPGERPSENLPAPSVPSCLDGEPGPNSFLTNQSRGCRAPGFLLGRGFSCSRMKSR